MKSINLAIAVCLIVFVGVGIYLPAYGASIVIFADDFSGTQLSPSYSIMNPSALSVSNSILHIVTTDYTYTQVAIPVIISTSLQVTARVMAHSFGRFQVAATNQTGPGLNPGRGGIGANDNVVAVEFDSVDTVSNPSQQGNFVWEAASNWNDTYDFTRISYSLNTWYQLQMTVNASFATWSLLNDTAGSVIESFSAPIPQLLRAFSTPTYSYSYDSVRFITLTAGAPGSYDVDWITVTSPAQPPTHSGSSGSTTLIVNPRTTSTIVTCAPAAVQAGQTSTCTARVVDVASGTTSTPIGIVSWTSNGPGTFSSTTCTLSGAGATASCSVSYTPRASGSQVITASYGGDAVQPASTQPATLVVNSGPLLGGWMLVGLMGGVGLVGVAVGVAVTLLVRRRGSNH